jgi:hypothetical protein
VLRIEYVPSHSGTTFILTGRITSEDVQELKARMSEARQPVALDLQQVRLVHLDAAHFLAAVEGHGTELRHLPSYVQEWILLEKNRLGEFE